MWHACQVDLPQNSENQGPRIDVPSGLYLGVHESLLGVQVMLMLLAVVVIVVLFLPVVVS